MTAIFFAACLMPLAAFAGLPDGLIVHYTFDGSSGTTVSDQSGNNKNGTLVGAVATIEQGAGKTAGATDDALHLGPQTTAVNYLHLANDITTGLENFSIAAWFKLDKFEVWPRLFDFGSGTRDCMFIVPQAGGTNTVRFAIKRDNSAEQIINGTNITSRVDEWIHVAVSVDYTQSTGTGKLYIDGVLVGTNTGLTIKPKDLLGVNNKNYIGKGQFNDNGLNGFVDDFRVYNRALTETEILMLNGADLAQFNTLLNKKILDAQACLAAVDNHPGWYNETELETAISAAESVEQNVPAVSAAAYNLEIAVNHYNDIIARYKPLKDEIAKVEPQYNSTNYPGKPAFGTAIIAAKAIYNNTTEQSVANIADAVVALATAYSVYYCSQPASPTSPLDCTPLLANPHFNPDASGWTSTAAVAGQPGQLGAKNHLIEYYQSAFTISQTIIGLPAGRYVLKAQGFVRTGGNSADRVNTCDSGSGTVLNSELYATVNSVKKYIALKDVYAEKTARNINAWSISGGNNPTAPPYYPNGGDGARAAFNDDLYDNEVADIIVVEDNSSMTIGASIVGNGPGAQWIILDNFRLIYYGVDLTHINELLNEKKADAQACLDAEDNPGWYNITELENVIAAAETVEQTMAAINIAMTNLETAINNYNDIIARYKPLKDKIAEAESHILTNYPGKPTFEKVINAAKATYNNTTEQSAEDIADAVVALASAYSVYYISQRPVSATSPLDITALIINPHFTSDANNFTRGIAPPGWTSTTTPDSREGQPDGHGATNHLIEYYEAGFTLSQTITGLPAGLYKLEAQGFERTGGNSAARVTACDNGATLNSELYATVNSVKKHTALKNVYAEKTARNVNAWANNNIYYPTGTEGARAAFDDNLYENVLEDIIVPENNGTMEIGASIDKKYEGAQWIILDNFRLYYYGTLPFTIEATETGSSADYLAGPYGDIIIKSNESSTGQLIISEETLQVNGVVKYQKTFTPKKWYPIGFPFAIASINAFEDEVLDYYNGDGTPDSADKGDFWLKSYNGDVFNYATAFDAGKGYAIQFPDDFLDEEVTFISVANPVLSNTNTLASALPTGYTLVANPSVANTTSIVGAQHYYMYNYSENGKFNLLYKDNNELPSGTSLKPFEAMIAVKDVVGELRSVSVEGQETAIDGIDVANDQVIETRYYNLQGIEIPEPATNGIYLVKKIYESKKVEIVKTFINKK